MGLFCEAGFLQVMAHDSMSTSDYSACVPSHSGSSGEAFPPMSKSPVLPSVLLTVLASTFHELLDLVNVGEYLLNVDDEVPIDNCDGG